MAPVLYSNTVEDFRELADLNESQCVTDFTISAFIFVRFWFMSRLANLSGKSNTWVM